jgi:hypothetical protein
MIPWNPEATDVGLLDQELPIGNPQHLRLADDRPSTIQMIANVKVENAGGELDIGFPRGPRATELPRTTRKSHAIPGKFSWFVARIKVR